jgi:hypothetical protein
MRGQFDSAATVRTLVALALGAAALSGCHPKHAGGHFGVHVDSGGGDFVGFGDGPVRAPASLTCPAQVDDLARTAQAADGKSCAYSGANGSKGQLGPIDASGGVHISADGDHDRANIDLPGFHLHANGDGKANISMPGVTINADGDKAQVNAGWGAHKAVVNANSNGAEVRAGSVNTSVADLTYVLASSTAGPTGLRAAGYMARGPAAGPLVVGVFRTPESEHAHELNDHGLQRLIRINTDAG